MKNNPKPEEADRAESTVQFGDVRFCVTADVSALTGLYFTDQPLYQNQQHPILQTAFLQLQAYFSGKRKEFDLPLRFVGTDFQQQVWRELQKIPYGTVISYKELAKKIENPRAVRAVGGANGKNPFPILIPCHRVIAHDGGLGGYTGGLAIKKALLEVEGYSV